MRFLSLASLLLILLYSHPSAAQPYEVKGIHLGGNLLAAYRTLKSHYGDNVIVKQWRRHNIETVSLIANRDYCGSREQTTCEQMTVSSMLPLYREHVVRIELKQTFIRTRTEQEVAASLVQKYGQPFLSRKDMRHHFPARVLVWSTHTTIPAVQVRHAHSWIDYRALNANFIVARFTIKPGDKVSKLTLVSEDQGLRQKNRRALLDDGHRFKQALIRQELNF